MRVLIVLTVLLAGCQTMSPEQLKASAGMTTCTTTTNVWGTVSIITQAVDETRKGATSENSTDIKCGNATMTVGNKVGVPVPPGSTTTTTTVVRPQ